MTINDREALAERLRQIAESQRMDFASPHVAMTLEEAADALTRQPQPVTVETLEELQALPHGTILRGREGQAYLILADRIYGAGNDRGMAFREIGAAGLPATVLTPATQPTASEPTDWYSYEEAVAMLEFHGVDAERIEGDARRIAGATQPTASEPWVLTPAQVEQVAEAAFVSDDLNGHHKPGPMAMTPMHMWANIPETGRENYRRLVRDIVREISSLAPTASETTEAEVENQGRAEAERRGYPLPDGEADDQSGWTFVEGVHYGFALRAARGVK